MKFLTSVIGRCFLASALILQGACASAKATPSEALSQTQIRTSDRLPSESELLALLSDFDVAGLAVATLTGCQIDAVKTVGLADIGNAVRVSPDTAFEAASLSKPVFAYLVLQLVEEGVIDLDAPLTDFDYDRIENREYLEMLTPRMILAHRTGMPNWAGDSQDESRRNTIPFLNEPGQAYSYSGEAYELLRAYVVEKTGMSLQGLFLERLGDVMPNSTFNGQPRGNAKPSKAYQAARTRLGEREMYMQPHNTGAAWGLLTTAGDYAGFLAEVCSASKLSPDLHAEMLRPQSPVPGDQAFIPTSYGLGWAIIQLGSETIVTHDGNNGEYRAFTAFLPETGEGYVFLTNGSNGAEMITAIMEGTAK